MQDLRLEREVALHLERGGPKPKQPRSIESYAAFASASLRWIKLPPQPKGQE
jgi:hypothetical protein